LSYGRRRRQKPVPAELSCRSPLVAVGATDDTLCYFGLDSTPRRPPPQQIANIERFGSRVAVIELQDDRIGLAAIDTWMGAQVLEAPLTLTLPLRRVPDLTAADELRSIMGVVLAKVSAPALAASGVQHATRSVLESELAGRQVAGARLAESDHC